MDPVAFYLFGWPVRWYGILISGAFLAGVLVATYLAKERKVDSDTLWSLLLIVVPAAIIGARLYYVIFNWSYYAAHPGRIIAVWEGGLAVHGGILLGLLALLLGCHYYKENIWQIGDIFAVPLVLGQAIGRWGNYFNREAYGSITDLPWAIIIDGESHHPTFLYESVWDFLVFIVLFLCFKRFRKAGNVLLLYFVLYSAGRLIIEGFRMDSLMLGPFRVAQLVSIAGIIIGLLLLYWRNRKGNRERRERRRK